MARVSTNRFWSAAEPKARRMAAKRATNCGVGSSNWHINTRRAAGAAKPARSLPAASSSARLATNRLLPTFGSPPTNRMPCGGSKPGSIQLAGGVAGCWASSCASERMAVSGAFFAAALIAAPRPPHPAKALRPQWRLCAPPPAAERSPRVCSLCARGRAWLDIAPGGRSHRTTAASHRRL